MANLLNFDVYDLELTTVKNNTALRKLLIDTKPKSIIVIEDIDCSLDLTGQRKKKNNKEKKKDKKERNKSLSQVTLSGLLNFIDGLWSACGEERIIVFTTNHIDDLDPALIRSGRMDFHIEMSYCCFESFKVLAKNYLGVESHPLFDTIGRLLQEIDISPADVAENLIPKTFDFDATTSFENLIRALNNKLVQRQRGELVKISDEEQEEEEGNEEEEDEDDDQIEKDNDSDEEE